jgi:hypothetical protein
MLCAGQLLNASRGVVVAPEQCFRPRCCKCTVANALLLIKLLLPRNRNGGSVADDSVAIGPRCLAVLK